MCKELSLKELAREQCWQEFFWATIKSFLFPARAQPSIKPSHSLIQQGPGVAAPSRTLPG